MKKLLAQIAACLAFDQRDLLLFAGLGLAHHGLAMVSAPASYIVPGAVLAGVAILGVR